MIVMEQGQPFDNAKSRDDHIDGFSNGNTDFTKAAIIVGALDGNRVSTHLAKLKRAEEGLGPFVILIGPESLKHFG